MPGDHIVAVAADLLCRHGIAGVDIGAVSEASGADEARVRELFTDRDTLIEAAVAARAESVLDAQATVLEAVRSMSDLRAWRDGIVAEAGWSGCPLGSLIVHLAGRHERGHRVLLDAFTRWEVLLAGALTAVRDSGELRAGADPAVLATGVMAALQGGLLLAQSAHDRDQLTIALDVALRQAGRAEAG